MSLLVLGFLIAALGVWQIMRPQRSIRSVRAGTASFRTDRQVRVWAFGVLLLGALLVLLGLVLH